MAKATATLIGSTLKVSTGVNKTIETNRAVRDSKTGNNVVFIGKVTAKTLQHPFVFVDLKTLETKRHSADYIAKYIG